MYGGTCTRGVNKLIGMTDVQGLEVLNSLTSLLLIIIEVFKNVLVKCQT